MKYIGKFINNLSWRSLKTLGTREYLHLLICFITKLPEIFRAKDLKPVDKAMGTGILKIYVRNHCFLYDTAFCDEKICDGTFSFGAVRELCIRDCYFRHHQSEAFDSAKVVVDLGANRGLFSTLMSVVAEKIISVEANPEFAEVINHNIGLNGFKNYAVETALIGHGGEYDGPICSRLAIDELFKKHNLDTVDFVKIDIEGSEFALFNSSVWLQRVNYLSMEVHQDYGNISTILQSLNNYGFSYVLANENLQPVDDPQKASFIYARKNR